MPDIKIKTGYHNIMRECAADQAHLLSNTSVHPSPRIAPLINKIALKRPSWVFVAIGYGASGMTTDHYEYTKFRIECDEEELGVIYTEQNWRDGSIKYLYTNMRLRSARQRNTIPHTKHLDKAVKLILDNFRPKTLIERMTTALNETNTTASGLQSDAYMKLDRTWRSISDEVRGALASDETLRARIPLSSPGKVSNMDALPDLELRLKAMRGLNSMRSASQGLTLMTVGNKAYTARGGGTGEEKIQQYEIDQLPRHLAMGLGMLRLVPPREAIPDIGLRSSDNTYFILDPEQSDE